MPGATTDPAADLRGRLQELTIRDEARLRRRLDRLRGIDDAALRGKELTKLAAEVERAEARVRQRAAAVPTISYPPELPVSQAVDELKDAIANHQVVVVAGETGSGKTTQLPKVCLELGRGVRGAIAHTQPRRIAARTVAERIASELDTSIGEQVGYAVRFNDTSSQNTLVRLMTDGLLLAEVERDRDLRRYDTIIVDEAHERSLNVDFLLGYLQRLLPRRPDLKVIITSATIEPGRFAAHFGDAPIVEVTGRTFPVEVRYRPLSPDPQDAGDPDDDDPDLADAPDEPQQDLPDAIASACEELLREPGRGDVLVFLSGEREIRDAAEVLQGRLPDRIEVLPLYARLSTQEQQRVFQPHSNQRVVLATNVAETSLTVPGIRYVVDPGTARISRYSARLKVQRLPIEKVSQASADQRKGRCGRVAEGICIRLYSERDFEARPRYTDPEVLRTSLAAVLLQMAALGLGDVEEFPFLDPPDRRQIRDGLNLLQELNAIKDDRTLTKLGRDLSRLPVDPRLGRMVLEADKLGVADEVIVIAAALSIQDVRERPADQRAQADQLHARFTDEQSDFLSILNLWRHLKARQQALSGNQFRKECKREFLHVLRIREWQDLAGQLRQAAKGVGITVEQTPGEPGAIHLALLSGLLSHVGLKDVQRREYVGARGARFAIFPGSALARRNPTWVMVAELVETSRLWGRTAARIEPQWVERLAEHLVKRSYSEPRWDAKQASVVATERVTLYGLPLVTGRTVQYGRIDPPLARALFLRRALVERDWEPIHEFFAENGRRLDEVDALQDKVRRRDLLVDDDTLLDFFDERVPQSVVSGAHFDRWWKDHKRKAPDLLTYPRELLIRPEAADALAPKARPDRWKQGELVLPLSYRFAPGEPGDGVTVHVQLQDLARLTPAGFDWLVPAFRHELVTALIRSLPKDVRRGLVPAPEVATDVLQVVTPRSGPLTEVLADALLRVRGVRVAPGAFDVDQLPAHLRFTFQVEDEQGHVVASGQDLQGLRDQVRPKLRARLSAAAKPLERHGLKDWDGLGELPKVIALPGTGQAVRAYPALVDEGDAVGVQVLDTPEAQASAMQAGTRKLLRLSAPSPAKFVEQRLPLDAQLALARAPHGSVAAVVEDATVAALDQLVAEAGGPAWDAARFKRLRDHVAGHLADRTLATVVAVAKVLDAARAVEQRMESTSAPELRDARLDVARQLGRLVFPGFVAAAGAGRLADVERYLRAAERRLDKLPGQVPADRDKLAGIAVLEERFRALRAAVPKGRPQPAPLRDARWAIEELRVAHFAQGLGVKGGVTAKKVRRLLDAAQAELPAA